MSLCRRPIRRIALAAKTGSFINKTIRASFSQQNIYTQLEPTYFSSEKFMTNNSSPASQKKPCVLENSMRYSEEQVRQALPRMILTNHI
ncbi:unnamed protein product [Adineta ricciae]|uniref:Uncharacterized protein n=1 Tax=Adineta ricciae TaxID=249248 RepID=A0A816DXJ8_ADIRI|nr:unnamed protein product [Adineta ricciae]